MAKIKSAKLTTTQAIKKWEAIIPKKKRTARLGRKIANECGFRSMGEVYCAHDMKKRKLKFDYEVDKIPYTLTYIPDFKVNNKVYIEYKGKFDKETRAQIAAVLKSNPGIRLCMVFERANNKLTSKKNSMRYWRWCELKGIPWAEKLVKKEWFTEKFWIDKEKG